MKRGPQCATRDPRPRASRKRTEPAQEIDPVKQVVYNPVINPSTTRNSAVQAVAQNTYVSDKIR